MSYSENGTEPFNQSCKDILSEIKSYKATIYTFTAKSHNLPEKYTLQEANHYIKDELKLLEVSIKSILNRELPNC